MGFALHATNGLDSPPAVGWNLMLDGNRLGQVVANFVSNALKFTPRGKAVRARVALVPLTAGEEEAWRRASPPAGSPANTPSVWLGPPLPLSAITSSHPANPAAPTTRVLFRLEVEDDGSGIAPADMPRLFKPFQQIQAGEKQRGGGTGLGLSISKSIVAMHGGRVGVWSKGEGEGSTFWFDVVADRARANAPAEQERRMQGSSARPSATPPAHGAPSSSVSHPVTSGALSSESEPSSPHLRRRPSSASHMQPGVSSAEGECDDDEPDDEGEAHEAAQARCWMGGRRPAFSEAGNTAPAARPAHTVGTFPFERFHSNEQCPVEPGRAVLAPLPKGTLVSPDLPAATPTAPAPLPMPAPVSGPAPAPAPAPFPAPARPPPLPLKGHSVLVADDSKPTRALMARLLERLGADAVLEAADGQEALDMCRGRRGNRAARPLSLLLLDQNMPRLMGKEVAVEAQELGFAGAVLLLTGDEDVGEVGHALPDGVQAVLVKPVSKAALVQALEDVGVEPVAAGTSPRA